jgi:hypothetical protein
MTTRWEVECWNCGGEGEREGDCTCMEDVCCCAEPRPPKCEICGGKGSYIVTQLTDDNCDQAIAVD